MSNKNKKFFFRKGFTLIELMVSISVFSAVVVVSMGSILSAIDANRRSQTFRNVMDNVNFSIEGMARNIRFGENYHCGSSGDITQPADCSGGNSSMTVKTSSGSLITYSLSGNRVVRSVNYGSNTYITPSTVVVESLNFWVSGSAPFSSGDLLQPRVFIIMKGYATLGSNGSSRTNFTIETEVSQRKLDI